ncbi:hypothetical protein SAMN04244553_4801 [Nocardia amikacinitolerans]|uniref:Uncharacterized protein n=2 Tax=Nocardia amikacinitolerans TaxID=756689 RepID=A0A285LSD9_9NOCA|nr:hypothetical protein [Nocardia amikacinitolerans]SNY87842.1 hypothetical protein SAMN04244553_4801 [Nocardia amikacinitolerans]
MSVSEGVSSERGELMAGSESAVVRGNRIWDRSWRGRYRVAACLAILGALIWTMQSLGACVQSQEGKWQDRDYLSVGNSMITADNLLALLCFAFLVVAGMLGCGAVLVLRGNMFGRHLIAAGAWLVICGQLFAAVLASIPIDAFHYSTPANLVFATPLVIFPLVTILCLT